MIHNAGVIAGPALLPVNVVAPYLLTALMADVTQAWLATTQDPEALSSGGYWHHGRVEQTHPAVHDERFQHELITALAEHTGTHLRNS